MICNNKTILVTGANRGIGKALSLFCAKEGAEVILVGRNLKGLEKVYDEICELGGKEPAIYPINLLQATPEHIQELTTNINDMFGKLDILIHNAAITGDIAPCELIKPIDWLQVIQLNLNVPFLLTQGLMPLLKKAPKARVCFALPQDNEFPKAYWGAYGASKAGLRHFALSLNKELQLSSVDCHCIQLPKAQTDMMRKAYPGCDAGDFVSINEIISQYKPYLHLEKQLSTTAMLM